MTAEGSSAHGGFALGQMITAGTPFHRPKNGRKGLAAIFTGGIVLWLVAVEAVLPKGAC